MQTIINDSEETINIGDKLMVDTMKKVPSKVRKGIPNEKVRLVLRKVPHGFVPEKTMEAAIAKIAKARIDGNLTKYGDNKVKIPAGVLTQDVIEDSVTDAVVKNIAALVIAEQATVKQTHTVARSLNWNTIKRLANLVKREPADLFRGSSL